MLLNWKLKLDQSVWTPGHPPLVNVSWASISWCLCLLSHSAPWDIGTHSVSPALTLALYFSFTPGAINSVSASCLFCIFCEIISFCTLRCGATLCRTLCQTQTRSRGAEEQRSEEQRQRSRGDEEQRRRGAEEQRSRGAEEVFLTTRRTLARYVNGGSCINVSFRPGWGSVCARRGPTEHEIYRSVCVHCLYCTLMSVCVCACFYVYSLFDERNPSRGHHQLSPSCLLVEDESPGLQLELASQGDFTSEAGRRQTDKRHGPWSLYEQTGGRGHAPVLWRQTQLRRNQTKEPDHGFNFISHKTQTVQCSHWKRWKKKTRFSDKFGFWFHIWWYRNGVKRHDWQLGLTHDWSSRREGGASIPRLHTLLKCWY